MPTALWLLTWFVEGSELSGLSHLGSQMGQHCLLLLFVIASVTWESTQHVRLVLAYV